MRNTLAAILLGLSGLLTGCATERSRTLEVAKVSSAQSSYQGPRSPIAVGKFDNRSSYMRGLFSDGVDRLGGQAILGADAALYIQVTQYGASYKLLTSDVMVAADARLVDLRNGQLLWEGRARASTAENQNHNSDGGLVGMLIVAAVTQVINTLSDRGHQVAGIASERLLSAAAPRGLLPGLRLPLAAQERTAAQP